MSELWVCRLCTIDWGAIATLASGIMAVGAALFVARKQQRIKEQELRLSLLNERRLLIQRMRDFSSRLYTAGSLDEPVVREFYQSVRDCRLFFDPHTAQEIESCFDYAWSLVAAKVSVRAYSEEGMHDERREEVVKLNSALRDLTTNLPKAIALMEEKTRVPESV